jgi:prepilin-type N-terminal cleavage/methylation domain-containing protein
MKRINHRSGFSLLEIIIVIIIIGVLASLALPRFFNMIEVSRATEALNTMAVVKRAADRCAVMAGATGVPLFANCVTWAQLGIGDPGSVPGAYFTYYVTYTAATSNWQISATRVGSGAILLTYNIPTGTVVRTAWGSFASLWDL